HLAAGIRSCPFGNAGLALAIARLRLGRQSTDRVARFLGGDTQVIGGLQVQPELRACLEPVAQAQGRVAGYGALAGNDLRDAIGRKGDLWGKFGWRYLELGQLVGEDSAGMDGRSGHSSRPLSRVSRP